MINYTATYTATLTPIALRNYLHRHKSEIRNNPIEPKIWADFMEWSRIDLAKHNSLTTLEDWADEFAEFDCCYEDWLDGKARNQPNKEVRIEAGIWFVYYPNSQDKELFAGKTEQGQIDYAWELAYEDIRQIIKRDEISDSLIVVAEEVE